MGRYLLSHRQPQWLPTVLGIAQLCSIPPATNFPGIVVGPNRDNRMVGKSGLVPDSSTERGMPVAH